MKIERKFEVITETTRRFFIRQFPSNKQSACEECGETMLPIAQTAVLFLLKQSRVFQIIESGEAHFTEAEVGELMICINSLARFLEADE